MAPHQLFKGLEPGSNALQCCLGQISAATQHMPSIWWNLALWSAWMGKTKSLAFVVSTICKCSALLGQKLYKITHYPQNMDTDMPLLEIICKCIVTHLQELIWVPHPVMIRTAWMLQLTACNKLNGLNQNVNPPFCAASWTLYPEIRVIIFLSTKC